MSNDLGQIKDVIIGGKHKEIEDLVKAAIKKEDVSLDSIINDAMIAAMDIVGQKFADSEIFVPEMLVSAMTMKKGLNIIKPLLQGDASESKGTIIICTVKGDMHDIGKNLVTMMLEGAGFNVVDLGVDLSVEKVIEQVEQVKPEILGLSALLTTTMPEMKKVIEALEEKGLRNNVKVIIGGAPVDAAFAQKIGADGYGDDATEAVRQARRLIAGN
ncbi:MAG: corrinoid protein [Proteobacteria bacterium]|nr:corrinoid protein [Pseudomonadota bacterium]